MGADEQTLAAIRCGAEQLANEAPPRAEYPRKAHMQRMSLVGRKAKQRRAKARKDEQAAAKAKARAAEVDKGLAAAIAEIIEAVPLPDEARARITELLRGGDGHAT